ncbi:type II toxin-antitoxin system PemK/MazF family toxin [Bordetella genomosp. 4]|uniref:Type II toxin-antitoxin system PemK/MazF family toxin n=1 Tax=Bordetella genomosp. 4 TaxID=463044 RepID=A0A261U483_9BORD|nr:hypothetical protein CAL20_15300 [Bordetella genomosp. 4]
MTTIPTGVKTGHVLICDFERGFVPPEMVKIRPVVVISKASVHSRGLCTIVPLSTTAPSPIEPWHVQLTHSPLPSESQVWAKCDMLYTVSFHRLKWPHRKENGKRAYMKARLGNEDLDAVFAGVRAYLPAPPAVAASAVSVNISAVSVSTTIIQSEIPPWEDI